MILVDSSIWIRHFRQSDARLAALLDHQLAMMHPFVLGELACGNLHHRSTTITDMQLLPSASMASNADVHHLLESQRLWGRGLGWIDLHLLASALLDRSRLWTHDQALAAAAAALGVGFP